MNTLPPLDRMYQALLARDPAFDGLFLVGVKTTGIFCRPVCPAKKPRRESVEFFATAREALHAGYRPCKRCRPMDAGSNPAWVEELLARIELAPGERLTGAQLRAMSIDPARASRYFKRRYGMTFQAYHRARRMGMALAEVRAGRELDQVGLRHGFQSTSGFREAFARTFGAPPGRARGIGNGSCLLAKWIDTPLGAMLAIANDDGLCLLEFVDRRALERELTALRRQFRATILPGDNAHLRLIGDELRRYFAASLKTFTVPLVLRGSEFQMKVWRRLRQIPHGDTLSYAALARSIQHPGAHRAVGRANGDNRLALVVPCHRVVRADGSLCGYGGGVWRKRWLLDHERRHSPTCASVDCSSNDAATTSDRRHGRGRVLHGAGESAAR